jgi:hypothetical protein
MDADGVLRAVEKRDFVAICIFGIKDIIRPEVPISCCHMHEGWHYS